jgi:hypothetical protein
MDESITVGMSSEMTSLSSTYFPAINVHENSEIALPIMFAYIICMQT